MCQLDFWRRLAGLEGAWRALRVSAAWRIRCWRDFFQHREFEGSGVGVLNGRIGKCLLALECWELGRFKGPWGERKECRGRVFKNLMSVC